MTSETFILVQTLLLVVIVSWAKAGLAEWGGVFIAATIIIGLIGGPLLRRREKNGSAEIPWKATVPVMAFAMLGFLSLLNPSFINPVESSAYAEKQVLETLAKREFAMSGNPKFIDQVMREMYLFRHRAEEGDKDRAIARFLLASRYVSEHPETTFRPLFERYLSEMKPATSNWLPSMVNRQTTWSHLYPLVLICLQGIWVFAYVRSRRAMRWLLGALAINCVLLAAAGIVQKLSYDPTSLSPEIWGLWEAPEPRYFFASFTYKNHWCAYAALGFGILSGLTAYWLRRSPGDLLRGSPVPLVLLGMGILAVSFPLSGSVLGVLLILGLGLPFIGFFCFHLLPRSRYRLLGSCFVAVLLPAVGSWVVLESNPEIKRESLQKVADRWDAMQDGRMPWRFYHSKDSWAMFSDNPVWGWGLGATAPLYPHYASVEILAESEKVLAYAHHDERFFGLRHSHNDWFQYLAETGIVGVILLMLVPLFALRKLRFSSSVAQWSLLACGAFALFSFVDFPSRTPACLIFFVVTFACALGYGCRSHTERVASKSSLPNRTNLN